MAVRRKPLSPRVVASLKAKAKKRKNITYATLAKVYRRGQGAFFIVWFKTSYWYGSMEYGKSQQFFKGFKKTRY